MNLTLQKKLELLPDNPGCYLYKDNIGEIIYVGKAKNLKNRVKSYFTGTHNKKTQTLVSKIEDLEYIIVNSEKEALLLENNLIKKYRPYFNIRLKDDKSYPYLMITKEEHPRLLMTRKYKKNNKNIYFGPYVDIKSATEVKKILDKIYPLRKCNPVEKRPCMYYQIGECIGPCAKKITADDYKSQISKIKSFLTGNTKEILTDLQSKLQEHIKNLEFEAAGQIHNYIKSIEVSVQNQVVADSTNVDRDYIGFTFNNDYICIQIFLSRLGNIIERKVEYFNLYDTPEEILYSYLLQYYALNKLPKEIYIDEVDDNLLSDVVDCKVIIPKRGNHRKILDTVKENATYYLNNNLAIEELKERKLQVTLNNIAEKLGVNSINSIDAFDNSNIMGVDAVSVKVNFTNGKKNTYNYRKFKIDESMGINDVQTMKEVLYRNYKDRKTNTELLIVDGGKNHLNVAIDVVHNTLDLKQIKIIGLAKNDKHITEYIITDDYEIIEFPKTSAEYLFLKQIQDEVHRFAITYHRATKNKNMYKSSLDDIQGIGKVRKNLLLKSFSSLEEIKNAPDEKLLKLGIPKDVIKNLKKRL
ncbi:excinuclease ABC subunit UvrC [Gemella haemolysans]|uniref:UvrABC system protein C n=1 Tax=Gemella haemolysans ATCC 10379 TaxID=546270 RepID=C5NYN4_9BACL|nr:excinuclease ABC subunit UvrC [Gemella haemolysans]EER67565.1 excinuclease ABC, C subunit [Gemella haemolysans ATCC 10379]KAA8709377.1 excinuclease ABC subunit UvrC [Gemella haemolysans]UBH83078.1 excinuclease ABC subunit UvrC [Gemella haemolysans]VEI38649.1 Excinuclease ABC subunit C [Gemella haemolysans]